MVNTNFTYIMENFWYWSTQGYQNALGFFFLPVIISGILGYIYLKTNNVVTVVAGIILIVGGYSGTGIFSEVNPFVLFLQIVTTLVIVGLIIIFVSRWRNK